MKEHEYDYLESEDSYEMAMEWIARGDADKAETYLKKAIALNPHFVYAYITLADIHARRGRFSDAVGALKRALREDPSFHRLHYLIARCAFKMNNRQLARRHIRIARESAPDEELYRRAAGVIG
ncbi:MAG TPA: tetratricopeptide repeat protein [Spirochaetota bacterium]|nr:tetratricopeptide repeat protein [Spirochaetota bacterium]